MMTPNSGATGGLASGQSILSPEHDAAPVGLASGMDVLTLDGLLPVEHLVAGDRIVTRKAGSAVLRGHRIDHVRTDAVEIRGGALGTMDPDVVLVLPASQMILLRDWRAKVMFGQPQVTVPLGLLVDHGFIRDLGCVGLTLHRLVFDRAEIVYAGGLELVCAAQRQALRPAA